MSNTLVICDNEHLSTLYIINLEVYLATSVELVPNVEAAISLHRKKKNFDLVITLDTINKKDAFKEFNEYRGSYGVRTPLIKIGAEEDMDLDGRTFTLSSRYNIKNLLKKSASILGVTAKQMAIQKIGKYYPVSMAQIESISKTPCNVYVSTDKGYKLITRTNEFLERGLKFAKESGQDKVFVKSSDRLVIINDVSMKLIEKIIHALKNSEGASVEEKIEILNDGYEFSMTNLFSTDRIKKEIVEIAGESARVMAEVIKDNGQLKALISTMMSNKSGYIFVHSMIASYVANHIINSVAWGVEGQSEKINFVLFFHDIYLAPIYLKYPELKFEKNLLDSKLLSDREKEIVLNHAKMAAELVVGFTKCPMGADVLIRHHHGMKKGTGFANKYPEDLSPLAKVILVSEAFVEQFIELTDQNKKPEMRVIIPKLVEEFGLPSYIKIIQTLVTLPL